MVDDSDGQPPEGDLSVTALYTAETWAWGGLPNADVFSTPETRVVFRVTNGALAIARCLRWNSTSLKISLLHRHAMIDHLVSLFEPDVVIEIASGLSRRGLTMSESPSLRYLEVDLPAVIAKKRELIARHPRAKAAAKRSNWTLVGGDARKIDLESLTGDAPRAVCIAEGLLMYLDASAQIQTWRRVAKTLARAEAGMFVFDLVPTVEQPRSGVVGRLLEKLMKLATGGRGFEQDQRNRGKIRSQLLQCGFDEVTLLEPRDVAERWSLPFPKANSQQLLFVCTVQQKERRC